MPSNRSGFTASARWSKPTDFSEHTSLPTEFARFSTVLTTNISLFHRRSPDHALGSCPQLLDPSLRAAHHPVDQKGVGVSRHLGRDPGSQSDQGSRQSLVEPKNPLET